jgi:Cthe_2314-like HEPN
MKKNEHILKNIVNECKKHALRMNSACEKMLPDLPIKPEKVFHLSDDLVEHIDQFIFRFSKLQDSIGQKLFKAVLAELGEDVSNKSFLDIFNRLEQLEIISNYEEWNELKNLRNDIAHEYEENENEAAEKLNLLFDKKTQLEKYLIDIVSYLTKKGFDI